MRKSRSLRQAFEVASDLQYDDGTEFNPKGSGLFADLTYGAVGAQFAVER